MHRLADHRETSRDGDALEYGPFDDFEDRDLAWFVSIRLDAPTTHFDVNVGATDPADPLVDGRLALDDDGRDGAFTLDFTTLEAHHEISNRLAPTSSYAGLVTASFERDAETRSVDLAFEGFRVDGFSSDETWTHRRDADGWGAIELSLIGDLAGRSALRIEIDARWREDLGGRVRATALDVDGIGDLVVDECFDAAGMLSYRNVSPVDAVLPGFAFGDERSCVSTADELSRGGARSAAQLGRE